MKWGEGEKGRENEKRKEEKEKVKRDVEEAVWVEERGEIRGRQPEHSQEKKSRYLLTVAKTIKPYRWWPGRWDHASARPLTTATTTSGTATTTTTTTFTNQTIITSPYSNLTITNIKFLNICTLPWMCEAYH